jgi:RNA polymerase sigma factor (sigma-70 family)
MEASALHAPAGLARTRISVSAPLLRLRSDDQLLALFRTGNDDAFRVIHDRYRQRLFAYTKQMLPPGCTQDAEDVLQDVFVRAYSGLRANRRQLTLRPWLYRVAHNRCVDELRRPVPPMPELLDHAGLPTQDPASQVEQRESLQRLIADLRRLPDQQRSALLMRELGGMTYADVAAALDVSVPAVKSLLVRARIGLALAVEARDTACIEIRDEIMLAHDRGVRASGNVRRHLIDCDGCRQFRGELRGSSRQFAALVPALGPMGVIANLLGIGGGGAGAAATGGATATTGAAVGGGTAASAGTLAVGATHVATLIAAAVVTAGGAVAIQSTIAPAHHRHVVHTQAAGPSAAPVVAPPAYQAPAGDTEATAPATVPAGTLPAATEQSGATTQNAGSKTPSATPISGGDNIVPTAIQSGGTTNSTAPATTGETPTGTVTPTGTNGSSGTSTGTGTSPATSSTGSASPTNGGSTGSTGTGTADTSSTGTGSPAGTTAAAGQLAGSTAGPVAGTPTGT